MKISRRTFLGVSAASLLAATGESIEAKIPKILKSEKNGDSLKIKFLGTGSAGGLGKNRLGRRHSSILVDDGFLIDFTAESGDMIPEGVHPEIIFYTHSHKDHFNAADAIALGIKKVYLSHTWYDIAVKAFKDAAKKAGAQAPDITPVYPGTPVMVHGVSVLPLWANHPTEYAMEEAQIYLLEKGGVHLLYATDTSGIPGRSARMIGIDSHYPGYGITALIMEATMGIGHDTDFRIFCHSSVAMVERTVSVLLNTKRLHLAPGEKVYITHMSKSLHGSQAELDATLPAPLQAAHDGLEVVFTAPEEQTA